MIEWNPSSKALNLSPPTPLKQREKTLGWWTPEGIHPASGDAALKVQPQDIVGLSEAIKRVLADARMADDMRARGLQQAAKFSWAATARQTLDAYWKALA